MPSAHGPIFCLRQNIGVKIGSCAMTFTQIENSSDFFSELLTTKNSPCDVIQHRDLACYRARKSRDYLA